MGGSGNTKSQETGKSPYHPSTFSSAHPSSVVSTNPNGPAPKTQDSTNNAEIQMDDCELCLSQSKVVFMNSVNEVADHFYHLLTLEMDLLMSKWIQLQFSQAQMKVNSMTMEQIQAIRNNNSAYATFNNEQILIILRNEYITKTLAQLADPQSFNKSSKLLSKNIIQYFLPMSPNFVWILDTYLSFKSTIIANTNHLMACKPFVNPNLNDIPEPIPKVNAIQPNLLVNQNDYIDYPFAIWPHFINPVDFLTNAMIQLCGEMIQWMNSSSFTPNPINFESLSQVIIKVIQQSILRIGM